jgi:S1-C subfamily serine protease
VVGIDAKSPAAGRLLEGDIVVAIGTQAQLSGKGLATPEEFGKAIDAAAAGKTLIAYVQRNGEHIFVSFTKK